MVELIKKTRSYRRFDESRRLTEHDLRQLVELARLGGSARNQQPWQYMHSSLIRNCATSYFPVSAGPDISLTGKVRPTERRPSSYILCLLNRDWLKGSEKEAHFDLGIATQNLLLGAMEQGIGGCRIGAFSPKLADRFKIPAHLELSLVIALGYPAEKVKITEPPAKDDIRYWRDEHDVHLVPKRSLEDIIIDLPSK